MKTKSTLFQIAIFSALFFSCQKGKWSDNIQLSKKEFIFSTNGVSTIVTTKGTSWWLADVILDSTHLYPLPQTNACKFEYLDTNIQLVRKSCDTLFIKMSKTNVTRNLYVQLEAGDYFDGIHIIQNKK